MCARVREDSSTEWVRAIKNVLKVFFHHFSMAYMIEFHSHKLNTPIQLFRKFRYTEDNSQTKKFVFVALFPFA